MIAVCIQKHHLRAQYHSPGNPYHLAVRMGLEQLDAFLRDNGQSGKVTHLVFEARGTKEDNELELEFRRVCDGENARQAKLDFRFVLADKRVNSCGLQVADLIARPIG